MGGARWEGSHWKDTPRTGVPQFDPPRKPPAGARPECGSRPQVIGTRLPPHRREIAVRRTMKLMVAGVLAVTGLAFVGGATKAGEPPVYRPGPFPPPGPGPL